MSSNDSPGPVFGDYSRYYDLLYRDKDYAGEAAYVARVIRGLAPGVSTILELGSGTGKHGRLLAESGFHVHGIERSEEMVAEANRKPLAAPGSFTCEVGDVCRVRLDSSFDAVISLFHVVSYQTTDEALRAMFDVAARHLRPGGLFFFDVWHGPAVEAEEPTVRVKEVADEHHRVRRTATPQWNRERRTVNVCYDMDCTDLGTGHRQSLHEEHLMRYIFPEEVDRLAEASGFEVVRSEEFLTAAPPSASTWGVAYILRRQGGTQI